MALVKFNKSLSESSAKNKTSDDTVYFTTDTHRIWLNGQCYSGTDGSGSAVGNV